jgi:hypothetical protein
MDGGEVRFMIDTLRGEFSTDMYRAVESQDLGTLDRMASEALDRLKDYACEHPTSFALWALGIGFVLGWKLKPW